MKLIVQNLVPNGPGFVKLSPEIDDDMWDAYNLIAAGDTVEALTVRKIGGCGTAERVRMTLEIEVQSVEYDKEGSRLRVRGKNQTRNEYVQIGQYHTLELELKRPFVLRKELWDWPVLDRIEQSCDETAANADLAVLLMQEGLAHLFLVGRSVTATRARVEAAIPRKHGHGSSAVAAYDTAIKLFFDRVLDAFLQHVDFGLVQCVVIASPGFTKDQFRDYMLLQATRRGDMRAITDNKARIVLARAPSGFPHSLNDVLAACSVLIKDTRAAMEVPALQEFYAMMTKDSDRACYGPKHVEVAHERLAIKTLLLTDTWFRNPDVDARKKYVDLAESVKNLGGEVRVFSSMNVSGTQLDQLTGIAAILRFPLPELDDIDMDDGIQML